ncbi:DUF726 domain-containing protein [Variovorax ginsengisoli]|uniref:DUF726 domain-containing protein n=1 Tax=Variovorax ginsengisoli TaxID=363844 RepID=A0ABT8SE60_9BURK|nr:DUF726 domain-containing protein [Variovorax ginsengisoli]MDN8617277.1 DUF726 domain-containing protein [Variovorax ginsengisoli]MDO1536447.1 DUF726 domain-containing protein [Variovorax ginsengisoli]
MHTLVKTNLARRDLYRCDRCKQKTLECMAPKCRHMARHGEYWDDNLCAEHDGIIASVGKLAHTLDDIGDCKKIFARDSPDYIELVRKGAKVAGSRALMPFAPVAVAGVTSALEATSSFVGGIKHFDIRKINPGSKHGVIFVNGFLTEMNQDVGDWMSQLRPAFAGHTWYHLDWESGRAQSVGKHLSVIDNPWHASMIKARFAGEMLAIAIARTPGWTFTLMGHSLGARVIFHALMSLSHKSQRWVEDVYLLGGAVGGGAKDQADWSRAIKSARGHIYNCHSKRDGVLKNLYRGANGWLSEPIGLSPIQARDLRIRNVDCTDLVGDHLAWKPNFSEIHRRLHA